MCKDMKKELEEKYLTDDDIQELKVLYSENMNKVMNKYTVERIKNSRITINALAVLGENQKKIMKKLSLTILWLCGITLIVTVFSISFVIFELVFEQHHQTLMPYIKDLIN